MSAASSSVFAIDLHKVLIKPNFIQMFKLLITRKYGFLILGSLRMWYHLIKDGAVSEKIIDALDKKYREKGINKEFLITVLNCQYLITPTIEVFQKLKNQGYDIYVASNIWQKLFQDLMQKFPTLQDLFKGYYIPTQENNYIEKPDSRYFEGFKKYLATKANRTNNIIFVDDKTKNIKAAQREGFITITYKDTKTLIKDLKQLGFDV